MRTTLTIDDDVLEAARCLAEARGVSVDEALSTLARRGMGEVVVEIADDGFPIARVPAWVPRIDSDDVARILADFP